MAGAIPKLIKSDNESNSTPKSEFVFSSRASFPSILSKNEAKTISETEICHFWSIANLIAVRPKVKEIKVNKFGIKLLKGSFFMLHFFTSLLSNSASIVSPATEI